MKQIAKPSIIIKTFLILLVLSIPLNGNYEHDSEAASRQVASINQILEKRQNYFNNVQGRTTNKLVNILIVPGHDDEKYGAGFKDIREVDLNRDLAQYLYDYLAREEGINPVLASDDSGYNSIFEKYFIREKDKIIRFIEKTKKNFSQKIDEEKFKQVEKNFHNTADDETIYRLYGINRWVNDRKFDLVIHIHFNDYAGRKWNRAGKYDGFSIYTPGIFFENHEVSRVLADSVFAELQKIRPVSNLEAEKEGVIEDHELIAIGANESLEAASILVEYGYIYEAIFFDPATRDTALDYFAYATYRGIKNMFEEIPVAKKVEPVQVLKNKTSTSNLIWQFEKAFEGKYPPEGKSFRDCPISGYFGSCSQSVK